MVVMRRSGLLFLLLCVLLFWAVQSGRIVVPARMNPWAPLDLEETPNWLTRFKLQHAGDDRQACLSTLSASGFQFEPLPDRETGPGCGFSNAVLLRSANLRLGEPVSLSCRAALSLALWERHVLRSAANQSFGQEIVAIEHFGSYACRNVYGRERGRRSQHATADAFDMAGFVLANGRRIRIVADWSGDSPEASFLREVHAGACRFFDAVLGPDYNAAHRDHLHLDRGSFRTCR